MLEEGEDPEQHLVGETLDTRHLFTPGPHDSENTTHHHKDIKFKRVSMSDVLSRLIFLIGRNAISGGEFGHISNTIQQIFSVSCSIESEIGYIMYRYQWQCYLNIHIYILFEIQLFIQLNISTSNNQAISIFNLFSHEILSMHCTCIVTKGQLAQVCRYNYAQYTVTVHCSFLLLSPTDSRLTVRCYIVWAQPTTGLRKQLPRRGWSPIYNGHGEHR